MKRAWRVTATKPEWQPMVSEPAPIEQLVIAGNGKDLDMEVALAGGRKLEMGAGDLAVSTIGAVEMQLERVDDLNLQIRYAGAGLELRSMQIRFPGLRWEQEFIADLGEYLASAEGESRLAYCVEAKIVLAAPLPGAPARRGDPQ